VWKGTLQTIAVYHLSLGGHENVTLTWRLGFGDDEFGYRRWRSIDSTGEPRNDEDVNGFDCRRYRTGLTGNV